MQTFDLAERALRELNSTLHAQKAAPTDSWDIVNAQGQLTRLPCGLKRRST